MLPQGSRQATTRRLTHQANALQASRRDVAGASLLRPSRGQSFSGSHEGPVTPDVDSSTPTFAEDVLLNDAVEKGDVESVKSILLDWASINHIDLFSNTPLHYGVFMASIEVVKLLLESRADDRIGSKFTQQGNEDVAFKTFLSPVKGDRLRAAMKASTGFSKVDSDGKLCHTILRRFVENGASVETEVETEPLVVLFFRDYYLFNNDLAQALCEAADVHRIFENGNTLLHELVANCVDPENDKHGGAAGWVLLQRGANPNHANRAGQTPLMVLFTQHNNTRDVIEGVMKILISHGANPCLSDELNRFVVFEAAKRFPPLGQERILRHLFHSCCLEVLKQWGDRLHFIESSISNEQAWWARWESMVQADSWDTRELLVAKSLVTQLGDTYKCVTAVGCAVAAEFHLRKLNLWSTKGIMVRDEARRRIAGILHDCRNHGLPVEMEFYDLLLRFS
ncbi:hypothetical protein OQA88_2457 [Cercophora sp. LCS_1]